MRTVKTALVFVCLTAKRMRRPMNADELMREAWLLGRRFHLPPPENLTEREIADRQRWSATEDPSA